VLDVLRRGPGDTFDAGLVNGPRGKATIAAITADALVLTFAWQDEPIALQSITLLVGLPRPQTARDILRDATSLGVAAIHFVRTEKSDPSYAQSTLWTSGEWRRHLLAGAAQAFATGIPVVTYTQATSEVLGTLPPAAIRLALDNYESTVRLADAPLAPGGHHVLAFGGERGWSAADRASLRAHQFTLANLGERVLRTETAVIAALAIVRSRLGLM
jgi:RsmE family RNA methyltransferase